MIRILEMFFETKKKQISNKNISPELYTEFQTKSLVCRLEVGTLEVNTLSRV